ncbi:DNA-binding protein [Enterococcus faecium]|uniref:DNA-binding protein n=1 Tax=Enterococcus faecium TaxID=1352 RepID=UPI00338E3C40
MSLSETLQQNHFVLVERNLLLFVIPYIIIIYSLRKEVDIMDYISVKAASEKWGISERRIQKLCEENRIDGTEKFGRAWMIPKDAEKPVDGRMKTRNKQEENHGI